MKNKLKLLLLFLFCISIGKSFSQVSVTGNVVDEKGESVIGASVMIDGTKHGVTTDAFGNFSIKAPETGTLIISFVGFVKQAIKINNQTNFKVVLLEDAKTLKEVEITAEFGMKRIARAVGSSAQNVKATDITESGRDNFISALQGRVAGLNVVSSGGAPGSSNTVILRSITSISGNNQPLYIIDGVPMNNSSFDASTLGNSKLGSNNLDFSSRGNDFNPEDIESMTVLKGAAAAALYGSDASNGAIIITTKKGRAGKGQITYSSTFRWDKSYGYPEIQEKYANGAYGTTNYFYGSRYGGLYPSDVELYDNISPIFQLGFTNKQNISIDAGTEKSTIRAAFSYIGQNGVIKTTSYDRLNISLSGKSKITNWLSFEASMQYTNSKNNKAFKGTNGPLYQAMRWPIVDDMSNYLSSDGSHMRMPNYYTDTDMLNPLFGLNKNRLYDKADRFISTTSATINFTKNLFLRSQVGWDIAMQDFIVSQHPYFYDNNLGDGYFNLTKSNFNNPTLNILAGYNNDFFKKKLTISAQLGYHQLENGITQLITSGSKFIIPDRQSINNVTPATVTSSQKTTTRRIQAISAQVEFGYNNMVFITFRGRNDWSSTLPKEHNSYFYPAIEGALVLTELGKLKDNEILSFLKLRGTLARVGRDAGPLEIDPQLVPTNLTGGGYRYDFTGPNKNLRPEMTTSKEIGFEARFLNNRISTDFTYFFTHCADQIVKNFRLSYATGFVLNTLNVGTFDTWGWEWHIDGDIVRKKDISFNIGFNASHTNSKVVELPANVAEYYNPYTWASGNLRNGIIVGNPVTTITGLAYKRNDAGQILVDPTTGIPLTETNNWSVLGNREPLLRYGINSLFRYKNVRLSFLFSGRYKATVVNGTKRAMMSSGTSMESVNLRERGPIVFNGVLKDGNENTATPTKNNIAVDYRTYGSSIFVGGDEDWVEKNVNYLRLQELRIAYRIPKSVLQSFKILSNADLYVQGNDLFTLTNYSGIDAAGNVVSASAGGTGGEGYDVWSLPSPRGISVGFSLTFN